MTWTEKDRNLYIAIAAAALACWFSSAVAQKKKTSATTDTTNTTQSTQPAKTTQTPTKTPPKKPEGGQQSQQTPKPPGPHGPEPPPHPKPLVQHPLNPSHPDPYRQRPGDRVTTMPDGRKTYTDTASGRKVITGPSGKISKIEGPPSGIAAKRKTTITFGPHGEREVAAGGPGARTVSYGAHRGFVERPLRPGYITRTYVAGDRAVAHVYREYRYHDMAYYRYVPDAYYRPAFYDWAVTPWGAPVAYRWGELANPWLAWYTSYFTPAATYASANLWLTDYVLGESLRAAYENQQPADGSAPAPTASPDAGYRLDAAVKTAIANEVSQQLAAERSEATQYAPLAPPPPPGDSDVPPPALTQRFFVVGSNLEVTAAGQACMLTPGDVIARTGMPTADGRVPVQVASSKPGGCAAGETTVALADLQEMQNQFREKIDSGLKTLADKQASGLPAGPAAAAQPVPEGKQNPSPDAQSQLASQDADATKLEAQVRQGGGL